MKIKTNVRSGEGESRSQATQRAEAGGRHCSIPAHGSSLMHSTFPVLLGWPFDPAKHR